MKKRIAALLLPVVLVSFTSLNSCRNSKADDQKKLEMEQKETIQGEIESNVYPLPTSAEVIKMLTQLEVGYIFGISNPPANANKYQIGRAHV